MLERISDIQRIFFWIFMGLFIAASLFHLSVAFLEKNKLRRISKSFCLLFLGLSAVCVRPTAWPIYLGAFFGAIGDFFLIKKEKTYLVLGTTSFLLGHICYVGYMLTILYESGIMPWWGYLVGLGCYAIVAVCLIKPMLYVVNGNKMLGPGLAAYSGALVSLLGSSLALCSLSNHLYVLVAVGAILFIISDIVLIFTLFRHDIKRKDFYIMLSYLCAQALIVLSFVFVI